MQQNEETNKEKRHYYSLARLVRWVITVLSHAVWEQQLKWEVGVSRNVVSELISRTDAVYTGGRVDECAKRFIDTHGLWNEQASHYFEICKIGLWA